MRAEKILIATPLLKWYLEHGLEVTKIYQVVEFKPSRCFGDFEKEVTKCRRMGDKDSSKTIIADTMKLIGNSAYGSLIMDKEKHQQIKYVKTKKEACGAVNLPTFRKITELDNDLFEVELAKKRIVLNLPIYLGYFILQYAKLRMLQFYYDFLDVFVERSDFEFLETDTDSAYVAISGKTLEDVIKPSKRAEYDDLLYNHCYDDYISEKQWFPRECCTKHNTFDKRTPGVFKLEAMGNEMISLSSKTYLLVTTQKEEYKICSKGINPKAIENPLFVYQEVLKTQNPQSATNKGLRPKNNTIYTYEQDRAGLTYLYPKRVVDADGINTTPLDITLSPWKIAPYTAFGEKSHPLSLDYPSRISMFGVCFGSAREAYNFALCSENNTLFDIFAQEKKMKLSLDWLENRKMFMKEISLEKMRTNTSVRKSLLNSKDQSLYYTVYDRHWGVGMNSKLAKVCTSHRGSNILGEIWEEIRELYMNEINVDFPLKCNSCQNKRSDVKWNKESEENLCTFCAPSDIAVM